MMALRSGLLGFVANPDIAVLLLLCGMLLLYVEFNRPGSVVFGCLGALALMLGVYGLEHGAIRPAELALIAAGVAMIAAGCWFPLRGALPVAGTLGLIVGLAGLVVSPPVHLAVAIGAGIVFGGVTTWLGRVAVVAHGNKSKPGPWGSIGIVTAGAAPRQPAE